MDCNIMLRQLGRRCMGDGLPEDADEDDEGYFAFEIEATFVTSLPVNIAITAFAFTNLMCTLLAFVFRVMREEDAAYVNLTGAIVYNLHTYACLVVLGPKKYFRLTYAKWEIAVSCFKILGAIALCYFVLTPDGREARGDWFPWLAFVLALIIPRTGLIVQCCIVSQSFARRQVSQNRKRFQYGDFDLDLSYIAPNIIAMSFPATDLEAKWRNPRSEVRRFLHSRHPGSYKVYNLCAEADRRYDHSEFHDVSQRIVFPDHNPCPLAKLVELLEDQHRYLAENPDNVAAVHCKAGKGRTGMVCSCLLLREGHASTASQALELYARKRTHDLKGVTICSQIRYTGLYETFLREGDIRKQAVRLRSVCLRNIMKNVWFHTRTLRVQVQDEHKQVVLDSGPLSMKDLEEASDSELDSSPDSGDSESMSSEESTWPTKHKTIGTLVEDDVVLTLPPAEKPLPDDFHVLLKCSRGGLCGLKTVDKVMLSFWLHSGYVSPQTELRLDELDLARTMAQTYKRKMAKDVSVICNFDI